MAKVNGWAGRVLAGLLVLAAVGVAGATVSNTVRLAVIEGNRFTSEDGLELWREVASIRADMAALPQEAPPAWFLERVDRIDEALLRIHVRLEELEAPE
jgi:hypothetical protein